MSYTYDTIYHFITAHSSLTHCGIHSFNKYSPCPLATLNIEKFTGRRRNWVGSALAYINSQVKATLTADISSQIDTKKERHCFNEQHFAQTAQSLYLSVKKAPKWWTKHN